VLSTTVSSRVNDKFNSLLSDQEDDFNKKLDNAKVLLINNVPASILSDFNNGQLQNVVDDDEIVVVDIDKDVFETDLIPGQASSADIVQATVVEDLNYARSVRDSGSRSAGAIGIATITSIAVGTVAVLAFLCLVFLALARRRRAVKDGSEDSMSALPVSTPTQSRTTGYSPVPGTPSGVGIFPPDSHSPSISGTYGETGQTGRSPQSFTSIISDPASDASNPGPVMPIDGHQTIVSSYNEFMSGNGPSNPHESDIMNSLPPEQPPSTVANQVPRTQHLNERANYLFAP